MDEEEQEFTVTISVTFSELEFLERVADSMSDDGNVWTPSDALKGLLMLEMNRPREIKE